MLNKKEITIIITVFFLICLSGCQSMYSDLLKKSGDYITCNSNLEFEHDINETRAEEIRDYFSSNTELNLNEIIISNLSDFDKTLKIASFVSRNIKHSNQKNPVEKNNAIYLWEYHKNIEKDFNCKYHSMFTNELLLSVGIINNYVWCMPKSDIDSDCHVVNNVWVSELNKWVMIDTDQGVYICDKQENPLSIGEIRSYLVKHDYNSLNVIPIIEQSEYKKKNWKKISKSYLDYLSKDFYWFTKNQKVRFCADTPYSTQNYFVNLLPSGFYGFDLYDTDINTNDDSAFWLGVNQW